MSKTILITGGAGFIGSHLIELMVRKYPDYRIVNADALTYAGNLENLSGIDKAENYSFEKVDIQDVAAVNALFDKYAFDGVIHLAAESHVDRSIESPTEFILTNVLGTVNLLNAARNSWGEGAEGKLFYHVSTDEVYGSLGDTGYFHEETPYDPRSPYSASKASSDHFVRAYYHTYKLPVVISNCSNNYGPYQFPEKLLPLMINNIKNQQSLPVYGDGQNVRDWLWVGDHCTAIDQIFHGGRVGETYNIGGHNERKNLEIVHALCDILDRKLDRPEGKNRELITFVTDRKGHDRRYAIDSSKLQGELGWKPTVSVEEGLEKTIDWYLANQEWMDRVTSGAYQGYYERMYSGRE
ncbi:dTDP-glucose 4,6-dehydratase [Lewinellaceae bacterium SD302]|nr:dTDP-glucose 4,6-dehydratase [Lewinellaceae bacterium SD302]